jgi:hypothetical protein
MACLEVTAHPATPDVHHPPAHHHRFRHAGPAHLDHLDHRDHKESLAHPAALETPVERATPDGLDPQDPLVPVATTALPAPTDLQVNLAFLLFLRLPFPETPVPRETLDPKDLPDPLAKMPTMASQDPPDHGDPLARPENLAKMGNPERRDPPVLQDPPESVVFAPSIALWMVEFSFRMALGSSFERLRH